MIKYRQREALPCFLLLPDDTDLQMIRIYRERDQTMAYITQNEIAKLAGVSRATVSKALNGAPDIAPKTAERIREQAKALGYLPNATARALKVGRSYNIGVLFSDTTGGGITHEYFSQILESVKAEAERLGYDITFISKDLGAMSMDYYEHAKYRSCDGVVIASADFQDPAIVRLATRTASARSCTSARPSRRVASPTDGQSTAVRLAVPAGAGSAWCDSTTVKSSTRQSKRASSFTSPFYETAKSARRPGKAAARSSRAKRVLFEHGAFPSRLTDSSPLSGCVRQKLGGRR